MKAKQKYLEATYRHRKIFAGNSVDFHADLVRLPNKKIAVREYLGHPGAVCVIPFISKDKIIMVRQYRYPVGETTLELPAGKLARGEDPAKCVRRELIEETGYSAKRIRKLLSFWPTPAFSNEVLHIYTASGLKYVGACPDEDEFLDTQVLALKEALRLVKKGAIRDSKTIIAVLWCSTASS